jgi:hypothetical protein
MARSKPAIILSIINKVLTLLTEIFPSSPFDFPIAATKAATSQNVVRGCRLPGTASKAGIRDLIALGVH